MGSCWHDGPEYCAGCFYCLPARHAADDTPVDDLYPDEAHLWANRYPQEKE